MKRAMGAKRGRRRRISKEEMAVREKAIINDIKAGILSYREIAAKHKVSLPTVNNKARKAGISRGRRKGAKIFVARPPRRKAATRKAARRPARRGRVAAKPSAAAPVVRRRRAGRRATRRAPRQARPRATASSRGFSEALRQLVLHHYPKISLLKFDRLSKVIASEIR